MALGGLNGLSTLSIAAFPLLYRKYDSQGLPWNEVLNETWCAVVILALILIMRGITGRIQRSWRINRILQNHILESSNYLSVMMSKFLRIFAARKEIAEFSQITEIMKDLLSAMAEKTKGYLNLESEDEIYASLLLFGKDENELIVRLRSGGTRETSNQPIPSRATMAYFVAKAGQPSKAIPDVRKEKQFSQRGLTTPVRPYKSILILPLLDPKDNKSYGIITVDSVRRYQFGPHNVDRVTQGLLPYVRFGVIIVYH